MSLFEWLVLVLLSIIAVLVLVAIFVSGRAATNARDAKDEAEHERLLVRGSVVTPEQMQEALERVLSDTGTLRIIRSAFERQLTHAHDEAGYYTPRRELEATPHRHNGNGWPDDSTHNYQPQVQSAPYQQQEAPSVQQHEPPLAHEPVPLFAGVAHQTAMPFGDPDATRAARRHARDPLGIQEMTDTVIGGLPPISAPPAGSLEHPDTDVAMIEAEWKRAAEDTQGWSVAWPNGRGGQPHFEHQAP